MRAKHRYLQCNAINCNHVQAVFWESMRCFNHQKYPNQRRRSFASTCPKLNLRFNRARVTPIYWPNSSSAESTCRTPHSVRPFRASERKESISCHHRHAQAEPPNFWGRPAKNDGGQNDFWRSAGGHVRFWPDGKIPAEKSVG